MTKARARFLVSMATRLVWHGCGWYCLYCAYYGKPFGPFIWVATSLTFFLMGIEERNNQVARGELEK